MIYKLANRAFPAEVVREARLCLLDFPGPILGGKSQAACDEIIDMARNFNGSVRELMTKLQ